MIYQEETFDELVDDITPLFKKHYKEIAVNQNKIKLNPDLDGYRAMCNLGVMRLFTVRDEDKLIAYFIVVITPHLHYKDHSFALNDIIYVHPDYRGRTVAYRMIKFVEQQLKENGISVLMINMKTHSPFDKLLEGLQFTNTERLYSKYIGA